MFVFLSVDEPRDQLQKSNTINDSSSQTQQNLDGNLPKTNAPLSKEFVQKQLINNIFDGREVKKRSNKKQSSVWVNFRQVIDENKNDITGFFLLQLVLRSS